MITSRETELLDATPVVTSNTFLDIRRKDVPPLEGFDEDDEKKDDDESPDSQEHKICRKFQKMRNCQMKRSEFQRLRLTRSTHRPSQKNHNRCKQMMKRRKS